MEHRECPRCNKCKHRTLEYSKIYRMFVVSCDAKECKYEKREDRNDSKR